LQKRQRARATGDSDPIKGSPDVPLMPLVCNSTGLLLEVFCNRIESSKEGEVADVVAVEIGKDESSIL
jgi:hypothetical protein